MRSRFADGFALLGYLSVPLRMSALLVIVFFAFLLLLASTAGLLGIPLAFIVVSWFFKYGFAVLDSVANGAREPPVLSYEMVNPLNEQRPLALAVLVGLGFIAWKYLMLSWSTLLGGAFLLSGALVLPAIIAVHAASDSIAEALNPVAWIRLIRQTAPGYFIVLLLAIGIGWLCAFTIAPESTLPHALDLHVPQSIRLAVAMYGWLAIFALIGALLYEHRLKIGFEPVNSPERQSERFQRELDQSRDRLIDRIFAEYRGGNYANAWQTAMNYAQAQTDVAAELAWMYERARHWPQPQMANRLAQELLPRLLAAKRTGEALDIARERIRATGNFRVLSSRDLLALAQLAKHAGDRISARALVEMFARDFPEDAQQTLAERLRGELGG
jgi:hypothetical protein